MEERQWHSTTWAVPRACCTSQQLGREKLFLLLHRIEKMKTSTKNGRWQRFPVATRATLHTALLISQARAETEPMKSRADLMLSCASCKPCQQQSRLVAAQQRLQAHPVELLETAGPGWCRNCTPPLAEAVTLYNRVGAEKEKDF